MMPQLVTVRVRRPDRRTIRVWVPVLPVVLVLSPILLLAAVGVVVACRMYQVNAMRALATGWRVFWALSGTRFDVEYGGTGVLVSMR
ncbi:hypothetical protein LWC34_05930 [Kibdelosporangium philippinense]|uniref:Uncharacterized protein n=1 Tax=Kibdelosporangium philippinense TaxID=211113 RepID=A0ABS8Z4G7_9PSEU|nr:hypothetical protein [Kibdelosporangium philippinense]MCE7002372.1 hypothetical protein [Kibdelosporangium philippinense]